MLSRSDDGTGMYLQVGVTGGAENSLTLRAYCELLSTACREVLLDPGVSVQCTDLPLPDVPDYNDLWCFLRNGGFDTCTSTVKQTTGREPMRLLDYVKAALGKGKGEGSEGQAAV